MNRILPIMLLDDYGFYKSFKYKRKKYLGDPFNILNILNTKGVDEASVINIDGKRGKVDYGYLAELASEAFFPLSYGGNVDSEDMALKLIKSGYEKIIFNSSFYDRPEILRNVISMLGSQAVSLNIDYRRNIFGNINFYKDCARSKVNIAVNNLVESINEMEPGEVFLSCIDRDGTRLGYDIDILSKFSNINSQVVLNCGAKDHLYLDNISNDFRNISFGGSAAFFMSASNEGVLITYPERNYDL